MAATISHRTAPSLDILVLEDQPDLLASIRDALGKRGHCVIAATDGTQALDRLDGRRFDVAICDLRLPRPDEHELLRRLRRNEPEGELIVMSAGSQGAERPSNVDDRALHHLGRPFDLERLMSLVGRVAEQRRTKMLHGDTPRATAAPSAPHPTVTATLPSSTGPAPSEPTRAGAATGIEPLVDTIEHFERG
ncbi:MAG: response regulator [Deltaproteobacteria bacterium]|nr:response regulator [Deltaproteobacteria bacterium]